MHFAHGLMDSTPSSPSRTGDPSETIAKDLQHHHLAAMEPRTDPCVAILPVVHAFAVRDTALVVSNVFVAIGSDENALPVLGTFLKVAHVYFFALPLHVDPKLTNGLDREIAVLV
jgi:hypothetical protein